MKHFRSLLIILIPMLLQAEAPESKPQWQKELSGFIKTDFFYDTRRPATIREGHFLLYPLAKNLDAEGVDIHAKDGFNILSIQSRIRGRMAGPGILGAKVSAMIEADFFGNENAHFADLNGLRLRHAFVKLNWSTTELLVGQFWHPFFAHECFPEVISFNTGSPFQVFSRNPQVRLGQKIGPFRLVATAASQRDFASPGPQGSSSVYLQRAVLPELNLQLQYRTQWDEKQSWLLGLGGGHKQLVPRLSAEIINTGDGTTSTYYVGDERVKSYAAMLYTKLELRKLDLRAYSIYGGNLFDLVMLGGYAVAEEDAHHPAKQSYTPVQTFSLWSEISTKGKIQAGLFGGYTRNLGTAKKNMGIYYSRGENIFAVYRVSPRLILNFDALRLAAELEYTAAQYGTPDNKGVVNTNLNTVGNLRALVAVYYFF